ncbi:putative E3 ubiquitin-protein ligase XBAT34 isoform X2 [Salvia miltiorrhiza]|uniref:putative E3 ubiquitin-protein ligase XBAT34 isoform X2 n=1 Tax=Salvia miltiorrhiza TaxID=226208 RepID=UPI0025AC28EC|nr:putative E3 ubiquitin-protein ligase XBAT34 isoform X2 [Salvia miltiorrhiza]
MGQKQSKDELLYQQAKSGNIEGVKALHRDGAGLEWIDKEGKTPLIAACMNLQLCGVAKTLIELGANVNAYRPGQHNGTPLHHAARRGLEHTVKLLLSHGANALQMNDNGQTPLDVARAKGHASVVRAIEEHVCLFSGWLRELYGPGFLELLAPQLLSRKVWVVILPIATRKLQKSFKLELVIYSGSQDGQPRMIVPLWKAKLEEPNFSQPDPVAIISNIARIPKRWRRKRAIKPCQVPKCSRIKLAPFHESETQHLQRFCNACKGIPQATCPVVPCAPAVSPFNNQVPSAPAVSLPTFEDEELARAIKASLQSASHGSPPPIDTYAGFVKYPSASPATTVNISNHEKSYTSEASASHSVAYNKKFEDVAYPSNDMSPVGSSSPSVADTSSSSGQENGEDDSSSSCTICLDAPVEGACIPCGHMAGCMSCLNEIKGKELACPVCRTKIDQVVRIYAV